MLKIYLFVSEIESNNIQQNTYFKKIIIFSKHINEHEDPYKEAMAIYENDEEI